MQAHRAALAAAPTRRRLFSNEDFRLHSNVQFGGLPQCVSRECPAQEGAEFEVSIFDNASEDGSWEIIQSFSSSRVRVLRSAQNRGVSPNFNRSLHAASGDTTAG
jgi:hypothetical protein